MNNRSIILGILTLFCLSFFLSACGPVTTAAPTARSAGFGTRPSRTPEPPTALPSTATPLPPPTQTPLPTATASLTPAPLEDFSAATIYSAGVLPHFQGLITLKISAIITGQYYAIVQDNKPYACTVFSDRPHLLYCSGPLAGVEKFVSFALYQKGLNYPIFQKNVYMPALPAP